MDFDQFLRGALDRIEAGGLRRSLRMIDSPRRVTPLEPPIRLAQIPSRLIPHWNVEPCSRLTPRWKRLGLAIVRVIAYNERFENTQNQGMGGVKICTL